ncbi:MAG: DUF6807 family protein [Hyphomicrobiales bacterium]
MSAFDLASEDIGLPPGAFAGTHRRSLRRNGRVVLSLTQGRFRPYIFPLYSPRGFPVTSEAPADHPHHSSVWFAADHIHCRMPVAEGHHEEYTYNFYVNDVFQGRAPGRIVETACEGTDVGGDRFHIVQEMEWRGPAEWGAPQGRLAASETRVTEVSGGDEAMVIDVASHLGAVDWDFTIGPTRHAYFNIRLAESMTVSHGGKLFDDRGGDGGAAVTGEGARWVAAQGPVGGGNIAGIMLFPHPGDHRDPSWFVTDWGVITVGPFRQNGRLVRRGEHLTARYRVLVHDGAAGAEEIAARYQAYVASGSEQEVLR